MLGTSVLVVTADARALRPLAPALRAAGNEVVFTDRVDAAAELAEACAVDIVLVDVAGAAAVADYGRVADAAGERVPLVALCRPRDAAVWIDLLCLHGATHVVAERAGGFDAREVATTVEKIARRDVFGIDKYLDGFGVDVHERDLASADDRDDLVAMIVDTLATIGAGREVAAAMGQVADELATNAIYNAPRDEHGRPRYAHLDRRAKIELDPWERVAVRFGCDGRRFVLSVADGFGALAVHRVRARLRDCLRAGGSIERKSGGAGLGLYTAWRSTHQLVVNVAPGRCTEVVAVADIAGRMRGIRDAGHSLHWFDAAAAPPTSIELSPELRAEMRARLARPTPASRSGRSPAHEVVPLVVRKPVAAVEPAAEGGDVSGQIVVFPQETLGVDTMLGLIRGAARRDTAIELGLRFLSYCYEAAVAYELRGRHLVPWIAAGRVHDWSAARSLAVPIAADCALARIARSGLVDLCAPDDEGVGAAIAEAIVGDARAPGCVVPVEAHGRLRYVLYGLAPRYGRPIARRVRARLQAELADVIARVERPAAA